MRIAWRENKQHQNVDAVSKNSAGALKEVNDMGKDDSTTFS